MAGITNSLSCVQSRSSFKISYRFACACLCVCVNVCDINKTCLQKLMIQYLVKTKNCALLITYLQDSSLFPFT